METILLNDGLADVRSCVATIGFFDGVHRGHRHLIQQVREAAAERSLASTVITFDRHPRQVLGADYRPQMLSTFAERMQLLAATGVDRCVVLPFNAHTAALTASDFMQYVLQERLGVKVLITGYDNRFGAGRTEGFDDYVAYGSRMGMEVLRGEPFVLGGVNVSSSVIRSLLQEGEAAMASMCLGYPYMLAGTVVAGERVGRRIGFPTANLCPADSAQLIPAPGVYAVRVTVEGVDGQHGGMMNIGHRPTFDGRQTTLEVNIFDFSGDIYGRRMAVSFVGRLREEQKFRSGTELADQLTRDADNAKAMLAQ